MSSNSQYVTVVIPTYNRSKQLRKAIDSVINQQVHGVVIHVFDNCSDDDTPVVIAEIRSRHPNIGYTRRSENIGALMNYADAIASVGTPFYLPLADDDWLLPGSLSALLEAILRDESLGAVISQTVGQTITGEEIRLNPDESWEYRRYEPQEFLPLWVKKGHFEWSSIIFRTSAVKGIGGLDVETGSPSDVDLQLQLFMRYPVELVRHRSAVYLIHADQYSEQSDARLALGVFRMIRKAKEFVATDVGRRGVQEEVIDQFSRKWCNITASKLAYTAKIPDFFSINKILKNILPFPDLRKVFCQCYLLHMYKKVKKGIKKRLSFVL